MSRLIKITPEIELEPEPTGQEYGYEVFEELQPIETTTCHVDELKEEIQKRKNPFLRYTTNYRFNRRTIRRYSNERQIH